MDFSLSSVQVAWPIPLLAALGISLITSTGGVSGAFLLLPFQVSVLGFVSPAVTPTNHLFNVVGIPGGVYRYIREGRMLWPLALIIILGTIPGVLVGSLVRLFLLPDPSRFKLFMGLVLLGIGTRLSYKVFNKDKASNKGKASNKDKAFHKGASRPSGGGSELRVQTVRFDLYRLEYKFEGQTYGLSCLVLGVITAVIGVIGGAYGVGGGAFIAPLLVAVFDLPVHTIAGATLSGTCITSLVGVAFFSLARPLLGIQGVSPDWMLGGTLGLGGLIGMYLGARIQRRVPARAIESLLALVTTGLAVVYVAGYFRGIS